MKKLLLILSIISVLFLAGCNTIQNDVINDDMIENKENEIQDVENEVKENTSIIEDSNGIESGENIVETELTEEELVAKYKISDNYVLTEEEKQEIEYNIIAPVKDDQGRITRDVIANNQEVISDGTNFKIECTKVGKHEWAGHDIYEIKINDKLFEIEYGETMKKVGSLEYNFVGIIDIDPLDNYKEILVSIGLGTDSEERIYRLTNEGLKLVLKDVLMGPMDPGLVKINNKYIIPLRANMVNDELIMGYYMYDNGEFKYIDRFLTGEKIKDENGNYTENFRNQVFEAQSEGSIHCPSYYQGKIVLINGKVKFTKEIKNENTISGYMYDIELMEDILVLLDGEYITIPKGTILKYDK